MQVQVLLCAPFLIRPFARLTERESCITKIELRSCSKQGCTNGGTNGRRFRRIGEGLFRYLPTNKIYGTTRRAEPQPSEADIKVTRDLIRAAQLLKIEALDHVIVGNPNHCSLRELGYFL